MLEPGRDWRKRLAGSANSATLSLPAIDASETVQRYPPWKRFWNRVNVAQIKGDLAVSVEAANHHRQAAEHHELAAKHHRAAAEHHEAGNHEKAGHQYIDFLTPFLKPGAVIQASEGLPSTAIENPDENLKANAYYFGHTEWVR